MVEEEETDVFDIALMQLYGEKEDKNCFINARFKKKSWGEKYVKTFSIFLFSKFPSTLIRTNYSSRSTTSFKPPRTDFLGAFSPPPRHASCLFILRDPHDCLFSQEFLRASFLL